MTQILSLQIGDVVGTEDRSQKRADEETDGSAFEGLLALTPNLQGNYRSEDQMLLHVAEKLGQIQGMNQHLTKISKDRAMDEPPTSPTNGGLGFPQHYANVGKTVARSYSAALGDAPGVASHSTTPAIAKTVKSASGLPSDVDIDNALRHNDLSRFIVKVTDQQTHFVPVGGPNSIDSNWAAISVGPPAYTSSGRRGAAISSRDVLDVGRVRHDNSRRTAGDEPSNLVVSSSPNELQSGTDAVDIAQPLRVTGRSMAELMNDPIANATAQEPAIRELTPAQSSNQGAAANPSAASQVISALFERALAADPTAAPFAPQFSSPVVPNHLGQSPLKSMTIELQPEAMGLVQVQMTSTDGVLVIRLEVERSETLASLDGASAELAARITSGGLQLSELVISPLKADRPSELMANGGSSVPSGGSSGNGSEGRQSQAGRSAVPRGEEVATKLNPSVELGPKENSISNNIGIFSPGRRSWRV